jgi:hypothetical protein
MDIVFSTMVTTILSPPIFEPSSPNGHSPTPTMMAHENVSTDDSRLVWPWVSGEDPFARVGHKNPGLGEKHPARIPAEIPRENHDSSMFGCIPVRRTFWLGNVLCSIADTQ